MKFGIIGCGLLGYKRAQAILAAGHQVALLVEPRRENRDRIKNLAPLAKTLSTLSTASCADIDACVVATPHANLTPAALIAIHAGAHVLVEKPGSVNLNGLELLMKSSQLCDRKVMVGLNLRQHPALIKAKAMVEEDAIGDLTHVRSVYGHGAREGYEDEWRCNRAVSGGGELIDQGVHLIDLANWFLGELELVHGELSTLHWPVSVEDNAFLLLKHKSKIAWLHASWTEWKNQFSFEIFGRKGKLHIQGLGGSYGVERLTYHKMVPKQEKPETVIWEYSQPDESLRLEIDHFVDCINHNQPPSPGLVEMHQAMNVVQALYNKGEQAIQRAS